MRFSIFFNGSAFPCLDLLGVGFGRSWSSFLNLLGHLGSILDRLGAQDGAKMVSRIVLEAPRGVQMRSTLLKMFDTCLIGSRGALGVSKCIKFCVQNNQNVTPVCCRRPLVLLPFSTCLWLALA